MPFDFDIMYVKGNTIPHVYTLSRVVFGKEMLENYKNTGAKILHRVEVDILPLNLLRLPKKQNSIKQDSSENKEKYTEQSLIDRETLQRDETQSNYREKYNMQWRYNSTSTNPKKEPINK